MEAVFKFSSVIILLVAPCYFGYMAQPTEMGLTILAGALGVAFANLDKLSEFSGAGFSAKMRGQVQAVVEKETESMPSVRPQYQKTRTSPIDEAILKASSDTKYTWRTLSGISKDANCAESEAWTALVTLVGNELVRVANKNKTDEMIWALTIKGRQIATRNA